MTETQPKITEQYGKFPLWFLRLFILITTAAGLNAGFEIYKAHDSSDWSSVLGTVDVYFNPNNHGESILEPGYKKGSGIWIMVPWGMCIIGIFLHRHVSTIRRKTVERGYR